MLTSCKELWIIYYFCLYLFSLISFRLLVALVAILYQQTKSLHWTTFDIFTWNIYISKMSGKANYNCCNFRNCFIYRYLWITSYSTSCVSHFTNHNLVIIRLHLLSTGVCMYFELDLIIMILFHVEGKLPRLINVSIVWTLCLFYGMADPMSP